MGNGEHFEIFHPVILRKQGLTFHSNFLLIKETNNIQITLFVLTLYTMTKFVIMTI